MIAIKNIRKINYLGERGLEPIVEENGVCYFRKCDKLFSLLESYEIQNYIFHNK